MRKFFGSKLGVILFVFIFLTSGNVYPQQAANIAEPIAENGQGVGLKPPSTQTGVVASQAIRESLNPYNIGIPEKFGKIEEIFQGAPGSPVVVHIQDAHANYEAQLNIRKILNHLSKTYKMKLIQLEGASSKLNPAIFETAYLREANLKLADYLMREGRLSGAEAFAIESKEEIELHGIENRMLYMENLRTFRSVYSHQEEINEYFKAMRLLAKDLRTKLLNEELLDLTRNMEAYAQEKIDLVDYLLYLNGLAEKYKLASLKSLTEITRFPNLVRILRLRELEQRLDEKALKKESEALKTAFSEKTSSEEVQELLSNLELKKKGMKPRAYFRKITSLADQHGIDLLAYPEMRTMAEFLILQDEIEHHGLFNEVHRLEKLMQKRLFKRKEERHLIVLLRGMDLLEQYFKLEVNREKLAYVVKHYATIKASYIKTQLDQLAKDSGVLASDYAGNTQNIDQFMDQVEYFYRVVLERDRLFVENVLSKVKSSGTDRTVLITGGFHTDGLTNLLRKQNVSYLVVIPKVDVKQGNEKYVKIMMEKDSEVGSVFAGTFALQLELNTGVPLEHIGPPGPLVTLLHLAAHLGAGLAVFKAVPKGVSPDVAIQQQRKTAEGFNGTQPFIKVTPVKAGFDSRTETATVIQTARHVKEGEVWETRFEIKVSKDGFTIKPISTPTKVKGEKPGQNFVDASTVKTNNTVSERAITNLPSVVDVVGSVNENAQVVVASENQPVDLTNALPYPGVMIVTGKGWPGEILLILESLKDNLYAGRMISMLIKEGTPLTAEALTHIQALTQAGNRAVSAVDVAQAVDASRQEQLGNLLSMTEKPKASILVLPILDKTEVPEETNVSQLLSLVETLRLNPGAGAILVGRDVGKFVQSVLKGVRDKGEILKRIQLVEVKEGRDILDELVRNLDAGSTIFKAYRSAGKNVTAGLTKYQLLTEGYVRILLPGSERGDAVSAELLNHPLLQGVVQLRSALQRTNVAQDQKLSRAFADIQIKILNLLPNAKTRQDNEEFSRLLEKQGFVGLVVPVKDEQGQIVGWQIGPGVEALVAQLFTDFLAAREIAIRA